MSKQKNALIQFEESFHKAPIVGILRGFDLATCANIADAYQKAGLKFLEVTMNTPGAEKIISGLTKEFPDLVIGAGTVCSMEDLDNALDAGSQFIVTPIINKKVIKHCVKKGIPIFPGAYTPSEIYAAWALGATAVKVFPATALGSKFIKDVLGPLNKIKLLPTGGVSKENLNEFLKAGAIGAGMGGTLFPKNLIQQKKWQELQSHFENILKETIV